MSGTAGVRLAMAAQCLIGTRFRLHGRDPASGLDCVGVVGEALRLCGRTAVLPRGYRLRMSDLAPFVGFAATNRLLPATGAIAPGDVLLVHLHGIQPHLLVAIDGNAWVHAHAGLGRVVRQNLLFPQPALHRWRLDAEG